MALSYYEAKRFIQLELSLANIKEVFMTKLESMVAKVDKVVVVIGNIGEDVKGLKAIIAAGGTIKESDLDPLSNKIDAMLAAATVIDGATAPIDGSGGQGDPT